MFVGSGVKVGRVVQNFKRGDPVGELIWKHVIVTSLERTINQKIQFLICSKLSVCNNL